MKSEHLKDKLYDYLTKNMDEEAYRKAEDHLEECEECMKEVNELRDTIKLLDQFETPPLPEDFKKSVKKSLLELPLPAKPLSYRIKEFFQFRPVKWGFEGIAVAAVLFLAVVIYYKSFPPEQFPDTKKISRDLDIKLADVNSPILIETKDIDNSIDKLKEIIRAHDGRVSQIIFRDKGAKVTVSLNNTEETSFIKDIGQLGIIHGGDKGFRDSDGNIVVVIMVSMTGHE
ncbi:MAG: hypothetical protein AB1499_07585 [Nitrospirota bacterium]